MAGPNDLVHPNVWRIHALFGHAKNVAVRAHGAGIPSLAPDGSPGELTMRSWIKELDGHSFALEAKIDLEHTAFAVTLESASPPDQSSVSMVTAVFGFDGDVPKWYALALVSDDAHPDLIARFGSYDDPQEDLSLTEAMDLIDELIGFFVRIP